MFIFHWDDFVLFDSAGTQVLYMKEKHWSNMQWNGILLIYLMCSVLTINYCDRWWLNPKYITVLCSMLYFSCFPITVGSSKWLFSEDEKFQCCIFFSSHTQRTSADTMETNDLQEFVPCDAKKQSPGCCHKHKAKMAKLVKALETNSLFI